jgi:hypothetical protein
VGLLVIGVAVIGVALGFFLNLYAILGAAAFLIGLFIWEGKKSNPSPGTSGKLGGMIFAFMILAPMVVAMLITGLVVNYEKVWSVIVSVGRLFATLFLR